MNILLPKSLNLKNILIGILSLVLLFSVKTCVDKNKQISKLTFEYKQVDSIKNQLGQTVILQKTEVVSTKSERDALKKTSDSLFNLRKKDEKKIKDILALYKAALTTKIDSVEVPYIDITARKEWEDSIVRRCSDVINYYEANSIIVPKTARDSTKNFQADFTATLSGININSLTIPDTQYIRFVTLKGGFLKKDQNGKRHLFKRKEFQTQVIHTNPLIHITGQNSAIYIPPKKPRVVEKMILIGLGILLGTKL